MNKSMTSTDAADVAFKKTVSKLRRCQTAAINDVCDLLKDAFALHAVTASGGAVPGLLATRCQEMNVKILDNKLQCEVQVEWTYSPSPSTAVYIYGIDQLLDGVKVERVFRKDTNQYLEAKVTIDLTKWPHVARNTLHSYLLLEDYLHDLKPDTTLLANHLFPNVSLEVLRLSVDLNVIEKNPEHFKAWFENLQQQTPSSTRTLPTDLTVE